MPKLSFVRLFLLFFAAILLLKLTVAAQSANTDARATIRAQMVEFLRYVELEKTVSPADVDRLVELWMRASQPELSSEARQEAFRDLYLLYYKAHGVDLSGRPQALSAAAQRAAAAMQSGARLDLRLPTPRGPLAGDYLHVSTQGRGKEHMLLIADGGIDGRELYRSFVTRHKGRYTMHIVTLPGAGLAKMMPWPEVYDMTRRPWINHIEQSLQALLAKIAKDKLVVIGTAAGGYFAARLALTRPEKVRAVVLVDALVNMPMPSRSNPGKPAALKERLAMMKTIIIPAPFFLPLGEVPGRAEIGRLLNTPNNTHPAVQNWWAFAVKNEALSKAWTLEALSNGYFAPAFRFGFELQTTDLTEDLKQLAVPMLAMCAAPDAGSPRVSATGPPLLSASGWQEVKSLYPHIPLSVALYHDTRSYISEDSPREFDRDLSDFLAGKPVTVNAQTRQSPYVGQESNKIKSLSASEIQSYLNGEGMGLAKAAELNGHPGPKHVLELADKLELSPAQKNQTQKSFDRMKRSAIRIGKMIVNSEGQLSELFASAQMDERKLQLLTQRIGRYEGELRRTHLNAHLEMKRILSPAQIKKYDELRGYRKEVKSSGSGANIHGSGHAQSHDMRKEMFLGLRTATYYTPDLERAKEWYTEVLEIKPYFAEPFYIGFNVGGFELGLQPDAKAGLAGLGGNVAYWGVESADEAFNRLIRLGATALSAVQEVGGGIKVAIVRDPFGNALGIIENPHFQLKHEHIRSH